MAMNDEKQRSQAANAGYADEEQAFERFIDSLVQLPADGTVKADPNCGWCNWRRGDSPRNMRLCGFHQQMRNTLRGGR